MNASALPRVSDTVIPGLLAVELEVHGDSRGWFKENYQQAKLRASGLPELDFVQNNVSYNEQAGVTRGVHAEPWTKYVSLATGRAFAAIVDLRAGRGFGRVATFDLTPSRALLVPTGCGNAFQTLEPHTAYTYLVTAHWSPDATYVSVDPFDPELAIEWPVPQRHAVLSAKDAANPPLNRVAPMDPT